MSTAELTIEALEKTTFGQQCLAEARADDLAERRQDADDIAQAQAELDDAYPDFAKEIQQKNAAYQKVESSLQRIAARHAHDETQWCQYHPEKGCEQHVVADRG